MKLLLGRILLDTHAVDEIIMIRSQAVKEKLKF